MTTDAEVEARVRAKMEHDGAAPAAVETFVRYWRRLAAGEACRISGSELLPPPPPPDAETLPEPDDPAGVLRRAAVVKLNGGLGTSMGLDRAKSLLPVKDGLSFLDLIVRQTLHLRAAAPELPLIFMNSFRTDADTRAALAAHPALAQGAAGLPRTFIQNRVPRLDARTLQPVAWPADPACEWCPPGHGDLYPSLVTTGLLPRLRAAGVEVLFVSNADNLGATLDPRILAWFGASGLPLMLEAADRTASDRKGGHFALRRDGGLIVRESAQCPPGEAAEFQDIERYRYFNTNNLWIRLSALEAALARSGGVLDLPMMCNEKTLDPADPASPRVIQIETAMGSAIRVFEGAGILRVPRMRFAPVKTTDDLLALRSDAYDRLPDDRVRLHPSRAGRPPRIALDPAFFRTLGAFEQRFPAGVPSLIGAETLEVRGDVTFGAGVVIRGCVRLAAGAEPMFVPDGSVLTG
jgi:UTP--glucose-1-phosphate uridylyltransferase